MKWISINIRIPETLKKRVDKYMEAYGYTNLSEFIRESVRRRIEGGEKA